MCTLERLRIRRSSFTPMEYRKAKRVMPYQQIQFYSDCICRIAERRGIHIDEAFELLSQRDGIQIDDDFLTNAELNVCSFCADAKWVKFVYDNREKRNFSHPYDIVIDPVADNALPVHFCKIKRGEKTFSDLV